MSAVMFYKLFILLISSALFFGCDNESGTESTDSSIYGKVTFLDGTEVSNAEIRLIVAKSNQNRFTSTDANGNYRFDNLSNITYEVSFISQTYEVNSYRSGEFLLSGNSLEHNFNITYRILDDFKSAVVSDSAVLIQFQQDGARIGNNFSAVDSFVGYHKPAPGNNITLNCDVYIMPANLSWSDTQNLTPTFVKENFQFMMSLNESINGFYHSLKIDRENIAKILSNPVNGFIFIKRTNDDAILKIPCVDFNNNDFGLVINY